MVLARRRGPRVGRITDLYVRPAARRAGVAEALGARRSSVAVRRRRCRHRRSRGDGVQHGRPRRLRALGLPRRGARARDAGRRARRAARRAEAVASSFGSIHVQTDDVDVILKAVEMFVPRLPGRSRRLDRDPAPGRLRHRVRRRLRPRPGDAPAAREGDLVADRARRDRGRRRAGGTRADDHLRPRRHRRRVRVGARVLRFAASRRGDRAAREPRRRRALHGASQAAVRASRPGREPPGRRCRPPASCWPALAATSASRGAEHGWADAPEDDAAHRIDR